MDTLLRASRWSYLILLGTGPLALVAFGLWMVDVPFAFEAAIILGITGMAMAWLALVRPFKMALHGDPVSTVRWYLGIGDQSDYVGFERTWIRLNLILFGALLLGIAAASTRV